MAEQAGTRYRVFCASMADVFDEDAPAGQLTRLWNLIRTTPFLDWQILTKRPHRIPENLPADWNAGYDNVWLGTSVEDERVLDRVYALTQVPAKLHFLSVEPLIGPLPAIPLAHIEWVIVGGESGPGARPMQPEWVTDIQSQCSRQGVAFFFKQWGGVNKKANGRALNGQTYDALPIEAKTLHINSSVLVARSVSTV